MAILNGRNIMLAGLRGPKGEKGADGLNGTGGQYELLAENFQKGTVYNYFGELIYGASTECWRTKKDYYIPLKKGDVIKSFGTTQYRALPRTVWENASKGPKTCPFIQGEYEIPEDDDYVFSLRLDDNTEARQIELAEVLSQFAIWQRPTLTKAKLNNDAKSVFCVMSYNVGGWYYGVGTNIPQGYVNTFVPCHQEILAKYKPDILACQEFMNPISEYKLAEYYFFDEYYCNFAQAYETSAYDGKALCTSRTMENVSTKNLTSTDGLTRCYQKGYITLNGKKVCVINTHFSLTEEAKITQFNEIMTAVANEEYFIITGDFNINAIDKASNLYLNTYQKALDKGYKLCNGGAFGDLITYPKDNLAIDNIIVSANINIKSVMVDRTKEKYSTITGLGVDHYPLVAYLEVF